MRRSAQAEGSCARELGAGIACSPVDDGKSLRIVFVENAEHHVRSNWVDVRRASTAAAATGGVERQVCAVTLSATEVSAASPAATAASGHPCLNVGAVASVARVVASTARWPAAAPALTAVQIVLAVVCTVDSGCPVSTCVATVTAIARCGIAVSARATSAAGRDHVLRSVGVMCSAPVGGGFHRRRSSPACTGVAQGAAWRSAVFPAVPVTSTTLTVSPLTDDDDQFGIGNHREGPSYASSPTPTTSTSEIAAPATHRIEPNGGYSGGYAEVTDLFAVVVHLPTARLGICYPAARNQSGAEE